MLKLKIEAANGAEMREQLEALLGVYGGSKELQVEIPRKVTVDEKVEPEPGPVEVKEEKPKRRKTKKDEEVKETPAPEETTEEETTSTVTKEQLIQEVVNASRKGQRDAVQKLLADFGAERTTALKPEQYQDFYNKITKL